MMLFVINLGYEALNIQKNRTLGYLVFTTYKQIDELEVDALQNLSADKVNTIKLTMEVHPQLVSITMWRKQQKHYPLLLRMINLRYYLPYLLTIRCIFLEIILQ